MVREVSGAVSLAKKAAVRALAMAPSMANALVSALLKSAADTPDSVSTPSKLPLRSTTAMMASLLAVATEARSSRRWTSNSLSVGAARAAWLETSAGTLRSSSPSTPSAVCWRFGLRDIDIPRKASKHCKLKINHCKLQIDMRAVVPQHSILNLQWPIFNLQLHCSSESAFNTETQLPMSCHGPSSRRSEIVL